MINFNRQRNRENPKPKNYFYLPHQFKMKSRPFINDAVANSGVIDFVSKNIAELRSKTFSEELVFSLSQFTK